MRTDRLAVATLAGALALGAGVAAAQVCEQPDPAHVRCRYVTSRSQPLQVVARGRLARGSGDLLLRVDGSLCATGRAWSRRLWAACRVKSPGVSHVAEAEIYNAAAPAGATITVEDSPRLAALPQEAGDLAGTRRGRHWPTVRFGKP